MRSRWTAHAALAPLLALAVAACGPDDGTHVSIAVSGDDVTVTGAKQSEPETAKAVSGPAEDDQQVLAASSPQDPPKDPVEIAPGHIPVSLLIGNVDPASNSAFAKIPEKYIGGSRTWGHKDAVAAFVRMAEAAAVNGYELKVLSSFRSFDDQKRIWEDKWTGKTLVEKQKLSNTIRDPAKRAQKILEYSSMPGTSRHHWGTDFDLNALDNKYFNTRDGKRIYDWLTQHAAEFGFCQPYTAKGGVDGRPSGYEEEKWHWSYMPIASWYLKQYPDDVGYERLRGFQGSETAAEIDVIKYYVQGINPECK